MKSSFQSTSLFIVPYCVISVDTVFPVSKSTLSYPQNAISASFAFAALYNFSAHVTSGTSSLSIKPTYSPVACFKPYVLADHSPPFSL